MVYLLPYIIHQRLSDPSKTTEDVFNYIESTINQKNEKKQLALEDEIEKAYLSKEIERLYER